ncbi:RING-type E3 ubiquitin transferase [Ranunculus cassubicifolius]
MNSTITSAGFLPEKVNGLGYFIGISVGLFFLIATIALASIFCKNALQTPHSSHHQRPINQSLAVDIGLDETTIQSYPTLIYSKATLDNKEKTSSCCSICLSDYENTDMLRQLPDCGHLFHMKCVDPWLHLHPTCPVCRNTPIATPVSTPLVEVVRLSHYQV